VTIITTNHIFIADSHVITGAILGTEVAIITFCSLVGFQIAAQSSGRSAGGNQTAAIQGGSAIHHRCGIQDTQTIDTQPVSVAQIAIVRTISRSCTIAGIWSGLARTAHAQIPDGTDTAVIADIRISWIEATCQRITTVIRTGIVIITQGIVGLMQHLV